MYMKYVYPAIFTPEEVEGRGTVYTVEIPDILGCVTEGDTISDAISMAREALAGCILVLRQEKEAIPTPSDISTIKVEPGQFTSMIDVNLSDYLSRKETKAIVKTVSIPKWLDVLAEDAGISYSKTLQEAVKKELGVQ